VIFTKFKRFIAVLLCAVVLLSFSLSAFASVVMDKYVYSNIGSPLESFYACFLSYCDIQCTTYNLSSEYDVASWRNLTVEFGDYVAEKDSVLVNQISSYVGSLCSSLIPYDSSDTYSISFYYISDMVESLLGHLYSFLSQYWSDLNSNTFCLIPFSMSLNEDATQVNDFTKVSFNSGYTLNEWFFNFSDLVINLCHLGAVGDDFLGCILQFRFDYGKLPIKVRYTGSSDIVQCNFLDYLNAYIEYYNNSSSGDSSDDTSSDTSSSGSNSDSSEDTSSDENSYTSINSYYEHFYRSLFYCVLSSYDVHIFSSEYVNTEYVLDSAMDLIWKKIKNHEFSSYSTVLTDFKNIAHYEYDNFVDSDIKFYQIDFSATEFHKRFYYGFYDIFFSVFDVDGDDAYSTSEFLGCKCVDFDGMTLVFSFDTSKPLGQGSQFSSQWNEKLYNFIRTYNGPLYIPFYKDSSLYFMDYTWNHPTYGWSKTFKIFDGYSMILYHENQPEDSIEYWYYDKNAIYETWTDWLNIDVPAVKIPSALQALDNFFNYPVEFINHFFLYTSDFFAFLGLLWDMIPNQFTTIMLSGFIIIFVTKLFTRS